MISQLQSIPKWSMVSGKLVHITDLSEFHMENIRNWLINHQDLDIGLKDGLTFFEWIEVFEFELKRRHQLPIGTVAVEEGKPYNDLGFIYPSAAELPKTHFETGDDWILVRSAGVENLPSVGQEIIIVSDVRGSQEEEHRRLVPQFFPNSKDRKVLHGWCNEIGFNDELQEWFIDVQDFPLGHRFSRQICSADFITYWRTMPGLPVDNYKRSPYSSLDVWNILQTELIAKGK